jgi:OHCU decarboxylase
MDKARFRAIFGAVYEHSPWLADEVFDTGVDTILNDADVLGSRFESVFLASGKTRQLAVLQAHPQLACARAEQAKLTAASFREQTGAGLDQCTELEFNQFMDMNEKYMNKNKFPFIIAVKGRDRQEILEAFKNRLDNDTSSEFQTALEQVCQIANFRIRDILHD